MLRTIWSKYNLLHFVVVLLLTYGISPETSRETLWGFLWPLITAESLFIFIKFLTSLSEEKTDAKSPVTVLNQVDKYLFYLAVSISAWLLNFLTWSYLTINIRITSLLLTCPDIQSNFFSIAEVQDAISFLHNKQQKLIRTAFCYVLSLVINSLARMNLNADPQISHSELLKQIDFNQTEYLWKFLQIFLVNTLVKIIGTRDSYKARIVKFFYQRGHLINIPTDGGSVLSTKSNEDPRQILRLVVYHRRWNYLYNPQVLNSLIELYQDNHDSYFQECFKEFMGNLGLRMLKFSTIWTLMSIFQQAFRVPQTIWIFPIVSLLVESRQLVYKELGYFQMTMQYRIHLLGKIIGCLSYMSGSSGSDITRSGFLGTAFFCEFISILDNQPMRLILRALYNRRQQIVWCISHQNRFNPAILSASMYLACCAWCPYKIPMTIINGVIGHRIWNYLYPNSLFVWQYLITFGWFSGYDLRHLTGLSLLLYLGVNLSDYRQIPIPEIEINMYHSYYHRK